jgi:hypothetical protein
MVKTEKKYTLVETPDDREQNPFNLKADLKTTLKKHKTTIQVAFKDMTLTVMTAENNKPLKMVKEDKYKLGDIGKMHYVREIKTYVNEGYDVIEAKSNLAELVKDKKNTFKVDDHAEVPA